MVRQVELIIKFVVYSWWWKGTGPWLVPCKYMDYVYIAQTGNAVDFGDLTGLKTSMASGFLLITTRGGNYCKVVNPCTTN